jgi:hypothetical protein
VISQRENVQIGNYKQSDVNVYRCANNYYCAGPVPVGDKGESCACPATYLNIGACCLSQNWIIGLACGSGGLLLLIFIAVVSWLCVTKSAAVAAANKMAAESRESAIETVTAYQHAANGHANHSVLESRLLPIACCWTQLDKVFRPLWSVSFTWKRTEEFLD